MPLPGHRYDADALDDLMMEYAGISFRDLPDGRWAHYLEETDSYYNYTSDFGLLGFPCTGGWVENGEYPADMKTLGEMVQAISSNNAKRYFGV